jgi:hypothetical protein
MEIYGVGIGYDAQNRGTRLHHSYLQIAICMSNGQLTLSTNTSCTILSTKPLSLMIISICQHESGYIWRRDVATDYVQDHRPVLTDTTGRPWVMCWCWDMKLILRFSRTQAQSGGGRRTFQPMKHKIITLMRWRYVFYLNLSQILNFNRTHGQGNPASDQILY